MQKIPAGRRERRREQTRQRLFQAAVTLFARQGFAATKVEDITEAADVAKGTFFNYFPSKEHVLVYFGQTQVEKIEHACEEVAAGRPVIDVLRQLAQELTSLPAHSPEMVRTMVTALLGNAEVRQFMGKKLANGRALVSSMISRGRERGEIRAGEPEDIARFFQISLFGTLLLWSVQPQGKAAAAIDKTMDSFFAGVAASRSPAEDGEACPAKKSRSRKGRDA